MRSNWTKSSAESYLDPGQVHRKHLNIESMLQKIRKVPIEIPIFVFEQQLLDEANGGEELDGHVSRQDEKLK